MRSRQPRSGLWRPVWRANGPAWLAGLGAMLCEILTGAPPFRGKGLMEVLTQTAQGDLADAFGRLDGCGADGELVRLAKGCLAPEPERRPGDGAAVAAALARFGIGTDQPASTGTG